MPRLASDTRWTWIFATILILVVVVVIGFLSGITSALSSIDNALGTTDETLVEVNDDADPLPDYVKTINGNLTAIDKALKPVPGQGVAILGSLTSIKGSTGRVNENLKTVDSSLVDTSSHARHRRRSARDHHELAGRHVGLVEGHDHRAPDDQPQPRQHRGRAGQRLHARQADQRRAARRPVREQRRHRGSPAARDEDQRTLDAVNKDTTPINVGLNHTHDHLTSICKSTLLNPLGPRC